jgi:hypothetical protein
MVDNLVRQGLQFYNLLTGQSTPAIREAAAFGNMVQECAGSDLGFEENPIVTCKCWIRRKLFDFTYSDFNQTTLHASMGMVASVAGAAGICASDWVIDRVYPSRDKGFIKLFAACGITYLTNAHPLGMMAFYAFKKVIENQPLVQPQRLQQRTIVNGVLQQSAHRILSTGRATRVQGKLLDS